MNKICTDIEQSKRLIESGIDVNTADMWYDIRLGMIPNKIPQVRTNNGIDIDCYYIYPAWSLTALLGFIDKNISNVSLKYDGSEWFIIYEGCEEYEYKSFVSTYPLDAAFEMICWLLENKKI